MATTVRISDAARKRLERIRARLALRTGRRTSLEEVLDLLTQPGAADRALPEIEAPASKVSAKRKRRVLSMPQDYGPSVRPEKIDETVAADSA